MVSEKRQKQSMAEIMSRLKRQIDRFERPMTTDQSRVLFDIANLLEAESKSNLTDEGMVDSGALRLSINASVKTLGPAKYQAAAISKGIPYAAIHEFGGDFTWEMHKAMMWTLSKTGKLGKKGSKGVVLGSSWPRYLKARPYLRPALVDNQEKILKMLRSVTWK